MKIFIVSLLVVAATAGDLSSTYKKHAKRGVLYGAPSVHVGHGGGYNGGYSGGFNGGFNGGHGFTSGFGHGGSLHHGHSSYAPSFAVKSVGYDYKPPSFSLPLPVSHHASHHASLGHSVQSAHFVPSAQHHHAAPLVHHAPKVIVKSYPAALSHAVELPSPIVHHVQALPLVAAQEPIHLHQHIAVHQAPTLPVAVHHAPALPVAVHQAPALPVAVHQAPAPELSFGNGFGHGHGVDLGAGSAAHGGHHGVLTPPSTSYGVPSTGSGGDGYDYSPPAKKFTY